MEKRPRLHANGRQDLQLRFDDRAIVSVRLFCKRGILRQKFRRQWLLALFYFFNGVGGRALPAKGNTRSKEPILIAPIDLLLRESGGLLIRSASEQSFLAYSRDAGGVRQQGL